MKARSVFFFFFSVFLAMSLKVSAQDTLSITFEEFKSLAFANSGQLKFQRQSVDLAENRIEEAQAQRILPRLRFESQHGWVPAVKSDSILPGGQPLPEDQYYLDPNLRNDWNEWGIYTKFSITALQPIFTWGGINKAIEAARKGAEAARYEYEVKESDLEIRLFDLYYSYVLALEVERLLQEAQSKISQIEGQLNEMQEEGSEELDESEIFKFEIFKSEFEIQKAEVQQNMQFLRQTWSYALKNDSGTIYEPSTRFLDPLPNTIESMGFYQRSAFDNRPELKALSIAEEATETYIESLKRKNLPGLYLGGYIDFAYTPNRPYQDNPFIVNNTNKFVGGAGITIRQDLNFFSIKANIERSRIELRRADYAQDAARDGIMLEVNDNYRNAALAEVKVEKTDEALVTAKRWLRQEQLDYDFGLGDVNDLTDAMQKELELRLQLIQNTFDLNSSLAKLNKSAGIPLEMLINEQTQE